MQRRKFLKSSTVITGLFPFLPISQFITSNETFAMDEVVKTKVGQFHCTVFRDLMFKYLAKDFFMNARQEELEQALIRHHITPDHIPAPFIAMLLQHNNKKILVDTGIGFLEQPLVFRGSTYTFKGRLHQLLCKLPQS